MLGIMYGECSPAIASDHLNVELATCGWGWGIARRREVFAFMEGRSECGEVEDVSPGIGVCRKSELLHAARECV